MPAFIPCRPRPAAGGKWGSFASIIAEDDAKLVERGRERLANGDTGSRPALMETYKPHGGEKTEKVYDEIPGNCKTTATAADDESAAAETPAVKEPVATGAVVKTPAIVQPTTAASEQSVAEQPAPPVVEAATKVEKPTGNVTESQNIIAQEPEVVEPPREMALPASPSSLHS